MLVVAGLGKLRSPSAVRESLRLLGLKVPSGVVRLLGTGEVCLGVGAAIWPGAMTDGAVAILYAGFAAFVLFLLRSSAERANCGCFGDANHRLGAPHAALNLVAGCLATAAAVVHPPGIAWMLGRSPLVAVSLCVGTAAAALAAYLAISAVPDSWRAYASGAGA